MKSLLPISLLAVATVAPAPRLLPADDPARAGPALSWPEGTFDEWRGFRRHRFQLDGCDAWVVEPKASLPGKPWSWCLGFPDAFADRCAAPALLESGLHHAHISVGNTFGLPHGLDDPTPVVDFILAHVTGAVGAKDDSKREAADRRGLLLEYLFEGDLRDTSGTERSGAIRGAGSPAFAGGLEGRCLSLDGNGSFVDSGLVLPDLKDAFTIECRVRPAAAQRPYADICGNHSNDFTGFAIQQEGGEANRYYFTYGTGKAWVYSRTFALAAGRWQHLAVVKTPGRLRVYLDGTLAGSAPAVEPLAASATPFMVGLGIAGPPRWFQGEIDDVRIWDRARPFRSSLPEPEQIERFLREASLDLTASSRWGLFACQAGSSISFGIDPERVPASIESISIAFECRDSRGREAQFPGTVVVRRSEGFQAGVALPLRPGSFRLAYRPSIDAGGRSLGLAAGTYSFVMLEPEPVPGEQPEGAAPSQDRATAGTPSRVYSLDGEWLLATDPEDRGREGNWWSEPAPESRPTRVPWIIQDDFPGYHGVAWYWREFEVPPSPHPGGRTLLRFWAVDYKADVWLNGEPAGGHEGGETPFVLDVTGKTRTGGTNRLAVRVLNPTNDPLDGMRLNQVPRRAKVIPYTAGASYDHGGIVDSVELLEVPRIYIEDLHLRPEPATGRIRVEAGVRSAAAAPLRLRLDLTVAAGGGTIDALSIEREVPPGESLLEGSMRVPAPRLWDLGDPYLYRVAARATEVGSSSFDERSARCGFRDFRLAGGWFRLNGRRLLLRSAHTVNAAPVGQQVPHDPDLFRRDLLHMKVMGFNCIRFIWGGATRAQLDLCDELGLLVYAESAASQPMEDSPELTGRFDRAVGEMIRRDRNHPSVVIWGLLNEAPNGPAFRHAAGMLPLVRSLDPTRLVALNSGRWDGRLDIGSFSSPGDTGWDRFLGGEGPGLGRSRMSSPGGYCVDMGDVHAYPRVPHTADTIRFLRGLGADSANVFLSEYGIGSAVDLPRICRHFEQLGKADAEDARYYRDKLDRFLADWRRWRLDECFASPEEFFAESLRKMAGQRTLGLNAIRANPRIIGHNLTGMMDHVNCGEGLFTLFRELKPGTVDAVSEALAPVRLCLFAEPPNMYRGGRVRLEAVLADEDVLAPGEYPVRLQVVGPGTTRHLDRSVTLRVPARQGVEEVPIARPFFSEDVAVDGPPGRYRFLAAFERGGAPTGGEAVFHVDDPAAMAPVEAEVVLWGDDPALSALLGEHGIRTRRSSAEGPAAREVILAAGKPEAGGAAAWRELAARIARGSTAIFLVPEVFREKDDPVARLPLAVKGTLVPIHGWLYLKDEWAKAHPIFQGLPAGGLLDTTFYREIIPDLVFAGQDPPGEAVAGAIKASQDYASGLMISVHALGAGRFILNTLLIRENLGRHPAADRLLRNLLRHAAADAGRPPAELPADFEAHLRAIGYE